ncbi:MAG: hypothetical protein CME25_17050 [Gemmatimonadetes bacterium]|nr:hypothetical protein [Gemmatimonadota bacterium]
MEMDYFRSKRFLDTLLDWEIGKVPSGRLEDYLPRMRCLLNRLGNPEKSFTSIIVGGTNGKGTVSSLLAAFLRTSGKRVGLYTSPHLHTIRERIQIDGDVVDKDRWARGVTELYERSRQFESEGLGAISKFEALTGLAAHLFSEDDVEFGIFEVGLGGRYDATNAWDSSLAVLTRIQLDHTAVLGNTLTEIASEKLPIARPGFPLLTISGQEEEVDRYLREASRDTGVELEFVSETEFRSRNLDLPDKDGTRPAAYFENGRLALAAALLLVGRDLSDRGISETAQAYFWPGRFEVAKKSPWTVLDGAHNPSGAVALVEDLRQRAGAWTFLVGVNSGHDARGILRALQPLAQKVILTQSVHPKAMTVDALKECLPGGMIARSEPEILVAMEQVDPNENLCVMGSLHLVAQAREALSLPLERDGFSEDVLQESLICLEIACDNLGVACERVSDNGNVLAGDFLTGGTDAGAIGRADAVEMAQCNLDDRIVGTLHRGGKVVVEPRPFLIVQHLVVQGTGLGIIIHLLLVRMTPSLARNAQRRFGKAGVLDRATKAVGFVIGVDAARLMPEEVHLAILVIVMDGAFRRVHRQVFVMRAKPIAMRIGIAEDPGLQHLVGRIADPRHLVRRAEGRLFDLGEIVVGIAVQLDLAHLDQRIILVRPDLGQVEGIECGRFGLGLGHDLDEHRPAGEIAIFNLAEQRLLIAFTRMADDLGGLAVGIMAMALLRLEVELDPEAFAVPVPQRIGVAAIAVHEGRVLRQAAIRHQDRHLMQRFGMTPPEVPHGRRAAQVGARVTLLSVNEVRELQGIADKEDGRVVAHHIPVALVGIEFQRKAAHVAFIVGRALFASHGGKAGQHLGLLAGFGKDRCAAVLADVMGHGEGAEGAPALGMDDPFGNAFAVLMGQLFKQLIVLHQQRTARAGGFAVLVRNYRGAGRGGHPGAGGLVIHAMRSLVGSADCRHHVA